jgi:hypothetical protein
VLPAVLRYEQSGGLPLDHGCDDDRTRLRGALDSRGDIGCFTEHFPRCVDHDLPGIKADPRLKIWSASCVYFDKGTLDCERGAHRALGVVLLRVRIAEQRHQPVAELFQHMAAETGHRR